MATGRIRRRSALNRAAMRSLLSLSDAVVFYGATLSVGKCEYAKVRGVNATSSQEQPLFLRTRNNATDGKTFVAWDTDLSSQPPPRGGEGSQTIGQMLGGISSRSVGLGEARGAGRALMRVLSAMKMSDVSATA